MKSYSSDLHQRAIDLYQERPFFSAVGKQLKVSHTWVRNMVRLWQATGALDAKYQNCGRLPTLGEREKQWLRQWLEEENGLTLRQPGKSSPGREPAKRSPAGFVVNGREEPRENACKKGFCGMTASAPCNGSGQSVPEFVVDNR